MIEPDVFYKSLTAALATSTGRPFGLGSPSEEKPSRPYGVIMPGPAREPENGGGFETLAWMELRLLIALFGITTEQVGWLQKRVLRHLIMEPAPVLVNGENVTWREAPQLGAIVDAGYSLFQCNDQYKFRLEA